MPLITVKEFMHSPVITLNCKQTLREVTQLFDHRLISGAPVVEEDGVVVGVISRTDIAAFLGRNLEGGVSALDARVEAVMTPFVFYTRPEEPIEKPLQSMVEARIHRLVVVDEEHRPVGIVTSLDMMAELLKILPGFLESP